METRRSLGENNTRIPKKCIYTPDIRELLLGAGGEGDHNHDLCVGALLVQQWFSPDFLDFLQKPLRAVNDFWSLTKFANDPIVFFKILDAYGFHCHVM